MAETMTVEEALAAADVEDELVVPVNDIFLINPETRTITVPETERLFGARQDMGVERKYFKCPKIVGDNIDLSQHMIFVSYVPSKQDGTYDLTEEVGSYWCGDLAVNGDYVTFTWRLSANAMRKAGYIAFAVYAKTVDTDGNLQTKWHTSIAVGNVLDTLPDGEQVAELYPDVIAQLTARMDSLTEVSPEDIASAVENYMAAHPFTESDPTVPSWAKEKNKPSYTAEEVGALSKATKALPNPYKLIFTGGVTAEYDGSGAVTVIIPDGKTARIEKGSTDTEVTLEPNKLYVFPEMATLSVTLAAAEDTAVMAEYHFIFSSGATATTLTIPDTVKVPSGFTVDANKIYEISIMENCLTYQSWEVTA